MTVLNVTRRPVTVNVTRRPVKVNVQGRGLMGFKGDKGDPGNLTGPASSVDENIPIFDGITGDKLKDSGVKLSDKADVTAVTAGLAIKESIDNLTYNGTDLTVKFADEIAEYADVWAWIKARITAVNYAGLNIGDYIPFLLGGTETIWAQIAGIDMYYRTGDTEIGHHIDFVSKDCIATTYQWNTTNINNGDATNAAPWMVSALKASLDGLVAGLPAGLQSVVIEKRAFLETRYSASGTLTNSTGWAWNNMGKLWIPTEYEFFGNIAYSTTPWAVGQNIQYPIFIGSCKSRTKGNGHNGIRASWWLSTVRGGNATQCLYTHSRGHDSYGDATLALSVPLCFRIG